MISFKPSQFDDWMTIITRRMHRFRAGVSILEAVPVPSSSSSSSHHPLLVLASLWRIRMCKDPDEQFTFHYQIQHWAPGGLQWQHHSLAQSSQSADFYLFYSMVVLYSNFHPLHCQETFFYLCGRLQQLVTVAVPLKRQLSKK